MAEFGAVTRQLPPGESTSVMFSIKVEENVTDGISELQTGHSMGVRRRDCSGKNKVNVHEQQLFKTSTDMGLQDTENSENYGLMQKRLHGPLSSYMKPGERSPVGQPPNFLGSRIVISGEALRRWRDTGVTQGLDSDADIATFLLNFFEEKASKNKTGDDAFMCSVCQTPLTLVCLTCNPAQAKHDGSASQPASMKTVQSPSPCRSDINQFAGDDTDDDDFPLIIDLSADSLKEKKSKTTKKQLSDGKKIHTFSSVSSGFLHKNYSWPNKDDAQKSACNSENCFVKVLDIATEEAVKTLQEEGLLSGSSAERLKTTAGKNKKSLGKRYAVRRRKTKANKIVAKRRYDYLQKIQSAAFKQENEEENHLEKPLIKRKRGRPRKDSVVSVLDKEKVDEKPFKCSLCSKAFKFRSNCRFHEFSHGGGEKHHKCEHCSAAFRSAANLKAHCRKHTGERPYSCEICGKSFARTTTLTQHLRIHTNDRPYKCEQCGEAFKQRGLLVVHKRKAHTFERPFSCTICAASFVVKGHLSVHMQCHTGLRPFLCEECGASFKQKGILKVHKMIHKGIRPFSCDDCGKSFYRQVDVRAHKRTHLNIRNIVCNVCGAAFGNNGTLKRHMQSHTGFRPFNCSECGKNFASNSELKVHQRIHTGHKPYICDVCSRGFQTMGNMKKHRSNRHKHAPPYVISARKGPQMREDQRVEAYVSSGRKAQPLLVGGEKMVPLLPPVEEDSLQIGDLHRKEGEIFTSVGSTAETCT